MGLKSSRYHSSQGVQVFTPNTNLVVGHPPEYTESARFYKNLSLAVKSPCRIQINDSVFHVDPSLGLSLNYNAHEAIKYFAVLDANIPMYFLGSW